MKTFHLFLLVLFLGGGCDWQQGKTIPPSGRTLKLGVIAPVSGSEEEKGENALLGIRTALHMQPLLDNGDRVELAVEDNRGSPDLTVKALATLSRQPDVAAVLLLAGSDSALALVPVADDYQVPVLALNATHPGITENNTFISQLGFTDLVQADVAALYVRDEMLKDRAAVFVEPDNPHYAMLAAEFSRKFRSVGGEIAGRLDLLPSNEELKSTLQNLHDEGVQFLYLAMGPEEVIRVAREIRDMAWSPAMMGSDGLLSSIILQHREVKGLMEGMMATDFYSNALPRTAYGRQATKLFGRLYSAPDTTYAGLGCEGASIILLALNRCKNPADRLCVNSMLRNTEGFQGLFGKISIHPDGRAERPIFVNVIDEGKMKFMVKVY